MQIIYYDIDKLKPYKHNPRNNVRSIKLVAESIKQFGFKVPMVIKEDGEIITGHTRLEASKLLGLKKVPVIIEKDLNEEQVRAFRLADNKVSEKAYWNEEKLEEEIKNIKDINMELLGFIEEDNEINWDDIEEITSDNYEKPDETIIQCPYCEHEDAKMRFKKVRI
jgi:ParB/RepB/Spo0J family partition protein